MRIELPHSNFKNFALRFSLFKSHIGEAKTVYNKLLNFPLIICFFALSLSFVDHAYAQPATPVGLVANPASGSGQVFLAAGPNQVGANNIVYRLFYSPTASAPANPLAATQYTFGTTAGDGGGTAAFGFNISGLTPSTSYTFWLYQYNTVTMLYSTGNSSAVQTSGAAPTTTPPTPAGLVANPASGSGQIFLAAGPNNVGSNNVVYRLFYSPTATAPANPLTATQYSFGTTAGDGGGTAAFGFNITGLTPGTSYTFWLYQYNTVSMLYSTGNSSAVQTSGAAASPTPPTPVGLVANATAGPGQVFLAAGPNNVGSNNVVYRLFYSPTASAPANPLTATQYSFGTTAGDGGGTAAFGFNITGLTPGTPYTFWLYQYNTVSMQYSTGNSSAMQTSGAAPSGPTAPSTNLVDPTCAVGNVINIYGGAYPSTIATNYNPDWGQSGFCCVNPNFNPGSGNLVLAYPMFNYQGTELTPTNASSMTYINFDIWTTASPLTTTIQVSPINFGTGSMETLVTIPYTSGGWTRVSLPKSAFTGMTWNDVRQFKFAANGQGSTVPVNIYLDNIYFSTCPPPPPPTPTTNLPNPVCAVGNVINLYGGAYPTTIATNYNPNWGQSGFCCVNPAFNPGTGNLLLAYPNFNYQGTELTPTNAASMTYINFDIWTNAIPGVTNIQVSPINFGTGTAETLVNVPYTSGTWSRVSLPKSAFAGMTWNDVRQFKFGANGAGSTVPVDIYLDNIYFSTCAPTAPSSGAPVPTCAPANVTSVFSDTYPNIAGTDFNPNWGQATMVSQVPIAGNNTLVYTGLNYQGIQLGSNQNLTGKTHLHLDVWTTNSTSLKVYLISPGPVETPFTITVPTSGWSSLDIPLSVFSPVNLANVFQMKFDGNGTIYLDNIYFTSCLPTAPIIAAPIPACAPASVISMYSNTYTNVPVSTWLTTWSAATLTDIQIAGNDTKRYNNVNFFGIETTGSNLLNLTNMQFLHLDFWTPNMTTVRVKLVDFGANSVFGGGDDSEHEVVLNCNGLSTWNSYHIPLSGFTNLKSRSKIAQMIISGLPPGAGTLYIDNVYFTNCAPTASQFVAATISVVETSGAANNDGIVCAGSLATLTASGGGVYAWSNGATTAAITVSAAGAYTVTVTNGCTATVSQTISTTPLPTLFNVTGTATICVAATGAPVGLSGSQTGVNYQLQRNSVNVGSPLPGTGSALSFGNQTVAGTYTVIATNATTGCNTNMNGSAILTLDTQAPSLICPANVTTNVSPAMCSAVVTYTTPVGTDNCPGMVTIQTAGLPSGSAFPVGVTTNAFRVTDVSGNTASCSFIVTVIDNILPVIACPANITENVDVATCTKLITYTTPVGTDNCPIPVTIRTTGFASGTTLTPGVYTTTYRVTDASNNTATCSFTTTIVGSAPIITCPPLLVVENTPGLCGAFATFAATTQANLFPPATITYSSAPGSFFSPGATEVTATATNSCGSSTCKFLVIVNIGADPNLTAAYTIMANNYVGMVNNVVKSGGIGLTNSSGTVQLSNFTNVTSSLSFVKAPILSLSTGAVVTNYTNGFMPSSLVPSFLFTSSSTYNSIVIPDNTTKILELSSYGDILVGKNATAIFSGNNVVKVKQLKTMPGARLQFNQDTDIPVKGIMEIGSQGSVNNSNSLVNFYVEGNATIKSSSRISANIHTRRLLIVERSPSSNPTQMKGLFVAHQVNAEDNAVWNRNELNCLLGFGSILKDSDEESLKHVALRTLDNQSRFEVNPNPSIDEIRITFSIGRDNKSVKFNLYDINGQLLRSQVIESIGNDLQTTMWNTDVLSSGMYFLTMESDKKVLNRKKISVIK